VEEKGGRKKKTKKKRRLVGVIVKRDEHGQSVVSFISFLKNRSTQHLRFLVNSLIKWDKLS